MQHNTETPNPIRHVTVWLYDCDFGGFWYNALEAGGFRHADTIGDMIAQIIDRTREHYPHYGRCAIVIRTIKVDTGWRNTQYAPRVRLPRHITNMANGYNWDGDSQLGHFG
jgi:hypothetical protein